MMVLISSIVVPPALPAEAAHPDVDVNSLAAVQAGEPIEQVRIVFDGVDFTPEIALVRPGQPLLFVNDGSDVIVIEAETGEFIASPIPVGGGAALTLEAARSYAYTERTSGATGHILVGVTGFLGAPPTDPVDDHIPDAWPPPEPEGGLTIDPNEGVEYSTSRLGVRFVPGTTVAAAETALQNAGVVIIAGNSTSRMVTVAAPATTDHSLVRAAEATLATDPTIELLTRTTRTTIETLPEPVVFPEGMSWENFPKTGSTLNGNGANSGLEAAGFPILWNFTETLERADSAYGRQGVTTLIYDGGFDTNHPDLQFRISALRICENDLYTATGERNSTKQWCTGSRSVNDAGAASNEDYYGDFTHGSHVAGTIGGRPADSNGTGYTGGNPVSDMIGIQFGGSGNWGDLLDEILDLKASGNATYRDLRVINVSASNLRPRDANAWVTAHPTPRCGPDSSDDGLPSSTSPCVPWNDDVFLDTVARSGLSVVPALKRAASMGVVVVVSAGNGAGAFDGTCILAGRFTIPNQTPNPCDSGGIPLTRADFGEPSSLANSQFTAANALWRPEWGPNPVIVVEALGNSYFTPVERLAWFSNTEGTVSAYGYQLAPLWTLPNSSGDVELWGHKAGTSMSTPVVSAVVSSMLLLDPTMTVQEVRDSIQSFSDPYDPNGFTVSPRIDPLGSMLAVDGGLLALLDVSDHTADGNRRVIYGSGGAVISEDDEFSSAAGFMTDPDGVVDIRDFRRFRDAWLQTCTTDSANSTECAAVLGLGIDLDGRMNHPKKDLNFDGCTALPTTTASCPTHEHIYPRFDFNGDGWVSIEDETRVNLDDASQPLTDVDVFALLFQPASQGTGWSAEPADVVTMLNDLMISGDIEVALGSLFEAGASDVTVTLHDNPADVFSRPVAPGAGSIIVTAPAGRPVDLIVRGFRDDSPFEYVRSFNLLAGEDAHYVPCGSIELAAADELVGLKSTTEIAASLVGCDALDLSGIEITLNVIPEEGSGDATIASPVLTTAAAIGDPGVAAGLFTSNDVPGFYRISASADLPVGDGSSAIPIEASMRIEVKQGYVYQVADERPTGVLGHNPSVAPDGTVIYTSSSTPDGPHDQLNRWNDGIAVEIGAAVRTATNLEVDLGNRVDVTTDGWALMEAAYQDPDDIVSSYRRWLLDVRYWYPTSLRTLATANFSSPLGIDGLPTGNGVGDRVFPVQQTGEVGTRVAERNNYQLSLGPQLAADAIRHADNGYTVGRADLWPVDTSTGSVFTSAIVVGDANLGNSAEVDQAFVAPLAVENVAGATTPTAWGLLGDRPDISASGEVVAFVGDRDGLGPAVYIAVRANDQGSYYEPVAITGPGRLGQTELEYLEAGGIHLEIDPTRQEHDLGLGVIHTEAGQAGLVDDLITVALFGTPNASGTGLAGGLFTMNVRIGNGGQVTPGPAIPVVQIGDTQIGAVAIDAVQEIGWHRVLTDGIFDAEQIDHQLAFWVKTGTTERIVYAKWVGAPDAIGLQSFAGISSPIDGLTAAVSSDSLDGESTLNTLMSSASQDNLVTSSVSASAVGTSRIGEIPVIVVDDLTPELRDVVFFTNRTIPADQYGGSVSYNIDGFPYWLGPGDSNAVLVDETTSMLTFTGSGGVIAIVPFDIQPSPGIPPTARAGGPYNVDAGSNLALDASTSTDDDGEIILYDWEIDGDGDFDDAHGVVTEISWGDLQDAYCSGNCTTSTSGTLSLRVTDDDALTSMSAVAVEITVDVQDFTLAILPNAELINPGTTTELRVEVGSIGGFAGDVDLDLISAVPDGYTVRIPSPRVTAPGSTAIYITAPTNALESSLDVHVRGTSGALVHDTNGTATVVFGLIPICYETVTGTVIDKESRQPIDGMEVSLTRGFNVRRTTTSTDGSYSFADVQANLAATFQANPDSGSTYFDPGTIVDSVRCGAPPVIVFELIDQHRVIVAGDVVEGIPDPTDQSKTRGVAPTASPIVGVAVSVEGTSPALTDAAGRYTAGVGLKAPDNQPFNARVGGATEGYWPQARRTFISDGPPIEVDLVLVRACTAMIGAHGSVTDQHGNPLADRRLLLLGSSGPPGYDPSAVTIGNVTSDANGNFNFPLAESYFDYNNAQYDFFIWDTSTSRSVGGFKHFGCDSTHIEELDVEINIYTPVERVRHEGSVTGRLVNSETGLPIEGVRAVGSQATGADGRFTIGPIFIGYDHYSVITTFDLNVNPSYYYYGTQVGPFTVVSGETTDVGDVSITPVHHFGVEGYVLDQVTGEPVYAAQVTVRQPGRSITIYTDENGYYARGGMIPPGVNQPQTISVDFVKKPTFNFPDEYFTMRTTVDLTPGEVARHDVPLLKRCLDATISGVVVDAVTGLPIEGADVNGYTTGTDGFFLLEDLGAGAYNQPGSLLLTASAPGYYTLQKSVTVFCGGHITVNFGAETGSGAVFGTVIDHLSASVEGARVVAQTGNDDDADAAGAYRIEEIPLGLDGAPTEWDFTAIHPDGRTIVLQATVTNGGETELNFQFDAPVEPLNIVPVAFPKTATVDAGASVDITLTGADADGDPITLLVATQPATGALTGDEPNMTYTAPLDGDGEVTFTYTASDGEATSDPATVAITIVPANKVPVANPISTSVIAGESVGVTLTGSDADGDSLTFEVFTQPAVGSLSGTEPNLTYLAPSDFTGEVTFTYTASDVEDTSAPATVTIIVEPVPPNNPPEADDIFEYVDSGGEVDITLTGSDIDDDSLTYAITSDPAVGALSGTAPNLTYQAPSDFTGEVTFTYTAFDGEDTSAPATVTITVEQQPAFAAVRGTVKTEFGAPIDGAVVYSNVNPFPNFVEPDGSYFIHDVPVPASGESIEILFTAWNPDFREITKPLLVAAGTLTELNFVFRSDGGPANIPPEANDLTATVTAGQSVDITLTGNDADNDALTFSISAQPATGSLTGTPPNMTYTAPLDGNGQTTFTYTASDGKDPSPPATVTITIEPPPLAPTLSSIAITNVNENGLATLSGDIAYAGSDDLTLSVDWGDGSPVDNFSYSAGTTSFSETHRYLDDNPTATSSDIYSVGLQLVDDHTGTSTDTTTATVTNVAPTLSGLAINDVNENGIATLTGDIADVGTEDSFTLSVDWGDGSPVDNFFYPAGTTSFSETHRYLDDDPAGTAADDYTVGVTLTDDDTGSTTTSTTVTVTNVAPEATRDVATQQVQYSDGIGSVSITAVDVENDTVVANPTWSVDGINFTSGLPNGLSLTALDCANSSGQQTCLWVLSGTAEVPEGTYVVRVSFTDDDLGSSQVETTIEVIPEDASAILIDLNETVISVDADGSDSSVPFTLAVSVRETHPDDAANTPSPGDINLAEVSMTLEPIGPGSSVAANCVSTEPVTDHDYNALLAVACDFSGVAVNVYTAKVTVDGGFYAGSTEGVLVVYDPSLGFTTGGGTYEDANGDRVNFGYTMKYNKRRTQVKGSLLVIRHSEDGLYRLKSNQVSGLALGWTEEFGWASFSGKATYKEPTWDDALGNHDFLVYTEDHDTSGAGADRFWITAGRNGELAIGLSMDGPASDNAETLTGGNIVIPHQSDGRTAR